MLDQDFYECTKNEQLAYIINLECIGDERFEELRNFYEHTYKVSFSLDVMRYDYSFLSMLSVYEAVKLYDCLKESLQDAFIAVVELDHLHLKELVNIHHTVKTFNVDVQSCIVS